MDPICFDFETAGIQKRPHYPPEPVGVAIKWPRRKAVYYAWGHPEGNNCSRDEAQVALEEMLSSPYDLLCHNAKFDLAVLEERMGLAYPAAHRIHDTMHLAFLANPYEPTFALKPLAEKLLGLPPEERDAVRDWLVENRVCRANQKDWGAFIAYAPGDLVGRYAVGDVERTLALFKLLHPKHKGAAYDRERFLTPVLHANERDGVRVDVGAMRSDLAAFETGMATAEAWLRKRLKAKDLNLDSNEELADALEKAGVVTHFETTPTGKRSVAKPTLTRDKFTDERVFLALGYRNRLQTCIGTFIQPWLGMSETTGRIYTSWRQNGAVTGRMSSSPNFQNMPKSWTDKPDAYRHPEFIQVPELPLLRKYILPDDGHILVAADYAGQEVRVAAHYESGELMDAYLTNPKMDPHAFVRDKIKELTGREYERRVCKIALFSTLYGAGAAKIGEQLGLSVEDARLVKQALLMALPGIRDVDAELKARARAGESYRTLGGRTYFAEPSKVINGAVQSFDYKCLNTVIQGSSADMTKEAMLRYDSCKQHGRLLLSVHDELLITVPKNKALDESRLLVEAMVNALPTDVPMLADPKHGPNFAEMSE